MNCKHSPLAIAIFLSLATSPVLAQQSSETPKTMETVIVTGTRVTDRTVAESTSPARNPGSDRHGRTGDGIGSGPAFT